jgi:hypothetical protein
MRPPTEIEFDIIEARKISDCRFPIAIEIRQQSALAMGNRKLDMNAGFQCAGCGEWNETTVDPSAGLNQVYVEDCQVCCQPNVLHIRYEPESEDFIVAAELE